MAIKGLAYFAATSALFLFQSLFADQSLQAQTQSNNHPIPYKSENIIVNENVAVISRRDIEYDITLPRMEGYHPPKDRLTKIADQVKQIPDNQLSPLLSARKGRMPSWSKLDQISSYQNRMNQR